MASAVAPAKDTLPARFKGRACLSTGFTQLCLEHLQTPKAVPGPEGTLRSIGGPSMDNIEQCLQRMVSWTAVVLEVIKTEFPDWEALAAFGVSQLADAPPAALGKMPARAVPQAVGPWTRGALRNLAGQFGVPLGKLEEEYLDHHRLAQSEKNRCPQLTSAQAWQAALAKSQATWQTRHNTPAIALLSLITGIVIPTMPRTTDAIEGREQPKGTDGVFGGKCKRN